MECFDDSLNQIHQLINRWEKRLTFENLRLSERYTKGELHLIVCFESR